MERACHNGGQENQKGASGKGKGKRSPAILIIALFVLILSFWGWYLANGPGDKPGQSDTTAKTTPSIDPSAKEYEEPAGDPTDVQGVSIPGWKELHLEAGEKDVSVDFYNPEANEGKYYLTFELRLENEDGNGTYEVLYRSGLVEPGLHIQNISLERTLEEGTYNATIHVQPYRMDAEKTPTNNADIKTILTVIPKNYS